MLSCTLLYTLCILIDKLSQQKFASSYLFYLFTQLTEERRQGKRTKHYAVEFK